MNLEYDKFLKGYKPSPDFVPQVTQGIADEYLHLMARNNELPSMLERLNLRPANVEVLAVPLRDVVTVPLHSSMAECGKMIISGSFLGEHRGRLLTQ